MRVFYINSRLLTNFYIIINLKFLLNLIYLFKVNETIQFNSSLFHEVSICAFFFFFNMVYGYGRKWISLFFQILGKRVFLGFTNLLFLIMFDNFLSMCLFWKNILIFLWNFLMSKNIVKGKNVFLFSFCDL